MKILNNMKIKEKLYTVYFIVLLIPILLISFYMMAAVKSTINHSEKVDSELAATKSSYEVEKIMNQVIKISNWITEDEDLKMLVTKDYSSPYDMYIGYKKYPVFSQYFKHYKEISDIRFYVTNDSMYTNSKIIINNAEVMSAKWYKDSINNEDPYNWKILTDPITRKTYFSLVKSVYNENDLLGVLVLYLNDAYLDEVMDQDHRKNNLILDQKEIINDQGMVMSDEQLENIFKESNKNNSFSSEKSKSIVVNDSHYFISKIPLEQYSTSQLHLITYLPKDMVFSKITEIMTKGYFFIVLVLLTSFVFIIFFVRNLDNRIKKVNTSMEKVSKGDFDIPKEIRGNDEISKLYENLFQTMLGLELLITEQYKHQIEEKNWQIKHQKSEFKRLSAQINPHFLYNSLEMIRMKAVINKVPEVAESVKILSKLIRKSLEHQDEIIPLSEELEFIELYLKIQKLRFGERITYDIFIPEYLKSFMVLPLLIQPLVENSFIHGIEKKEASGRISIKIEAQDNLTIEVVDDGIGMSEKLVQRLTERLSQQNNQHIGLFNVHQRIQYYYGEEYGLKIKSVRAVGTKMVLTIPLNQGGNNE